MHHLRRVIKLAESTRDPHLRHSSMLPDGESTWLPDAQGRQRWPVLRDNEGCC
jgi:hypothetical protein